MPILNPDGTPYRLTPYRNFDPQNPDLDLFDEWDAESIRIGGTPVYYSEVFISAADIDRTYNESRRKIWADKPVEIFGTYDPVASQQALGPFGLDSLDEIVIDANYKDVIRRLGKWPVPGSRIMTPHLREYWELVQCVLAEFKGWRGVRLQLICQRFQTSTTDNSEKGRQDMPQYRIDDHVFDPQAYPGDGEDGPLD